MGVYISPIAMGILVSLIIIYLSFIPIMVHQYRKYGTLKVRGNIVIASFIVYMITAWFMTVLPLPSIEEVRSMKPILPNLRPFLFVKTFLNSSGFVLTQPGTWFHAIRSSSFYTVAFNVVLTIPFGVYLRKYCKLRLPLVAAFGLLLSLFYEITQYTGLYGIYPQAYRFADVDDLIVNTLGAVVGYFFAGCIDKLLPDQSKDRAVITEKASLVRRALFLLIDAIVISVLFEISQVAIYLSGLQGSWDMAVLLTVEFITFILIPLLSKRRQTIGMFFLRLYFVDDEGQYAKTSGILIHNIFACIFLYVIFENQSIVSGNSYVTIILQLLLAIWLIVMIVKSILQKKICYFWEDRLGIYLKAYLPDNKTDMSIKNQAGA
jgi:glycopeptide antibiotics resistance protein